MEKWSAMDCEGIRLQTPSDNTVTIPHSKIWTESVSNSNAGELEAQGNH